MSRIDSQPEELRAWRAAGVVVDPQRQQTCEKATVEAIERAIQRTSRGNRRGRWTRVVLLAAAAAAGVAGVYWVGAQPTAGQLVAQAPVAIPEAPARVAVGLLRVKRDQQVHRVGAGATWGLRAGDSVELERKAVLEVTLPVAGSAAWDQGARGEIGELEAHHQRFALAAGHIEVEIPPDAPPRRLVVSTPHVDVLVTGTVFDVSVGGAAEERFTEVNVTRGHVELWHGGELVRRLAAGERWSSRPSTPFVPTADQTAEADSPEPVPAATRHLPTSLRKQNQLFRAALDARNAGQDERATQMLNQLLARYPDSPLAQEAKVERLRALQRLGRQEEARAAARSYLAEHQNGFAREEARRTAEENQER